MMIILPHIKVIFFMQRRKVPHFKVYQEVQRRFSLSFCQSTIMLLKELVFSFTNIIFERSSSSRFARRSDRILAARLQIRSDGAEVAVIARKIRARRATHAYFTAFCFHHFNGLLKFSSSSCNGQAPTRASFE